MSKQTKLSGKQQRLVLSRLLTYLKPHKTAVAIAIVLLILTVTGDVLGPYLMKVYLDDYLAVRNFDKEPILFLAVTYMGIQILNVIITYFQQLKFQQIALNIIQQLRIDVFAKISSSPFLYKTQISYLPDGIPNNKHCA